MSAPSWTKSSPQDDPPPRRSDGIGWSDQPDRRPRRGLATDGVIGAGSAHPAAGGSARDRQAGMPMQPPIGTDADRRDDVSARGIGTDDRHEPVPMRRHDDPDRHARADADAAPVQHDIAVPAPDGPGALVMTSRAGEVVQQAAEGLRFVNLRNHTLAETLNYAWHVQNNLTHIPVFRAMNVAFFLVVTAPQLIVTRYVDWVHLRLHRAVAVWGLVLIAAHFLNRQVDWLVPDVLDAWTWSATTWAWVAGGVFAFVLATAGVLIRGPRP